MKTTEITLDYSKMFDNDDGVPINDFQFSYPQHILRYKDFEINIEIFDNKYSRVWFTKNNILISIPKEISLFIEDNDYGQDILYSRFGLEYFKLSYINQYDINYKSECILSIVSTYIINKR